MSTEPARPRTRFRPLRVLLGACAVVLGVGNVTVAAVLGHCAAFGGTCPSTPPPLLEDDVFGSVALGGFIAVAIPIWLARPSARRLRAAVVAGSIVGLIVGLLARSAATG